MSMRFPQAVYKDVIRVARKLDFTFFRSAKGDHEIWHRARDSRYTTIPNWGKRTLRRKTLKAILEDFGITVEEFSHLRHGKQ